MMRWNEKQTFHFVKLYFNHEELWNCEHADYKLKERRWQAYSCLISEFKAATGIKLNNLEVRKKIKNLRSTYFQEVDKIKKRSRPDLTYRSSIKWFAFWHKNFNKYKPDDNLCNDYNPTEEIGEEVWLDSDNDIKNSNSSEHDPFTSEDAYNILLVKSEPDKNITEECTNFSNIKKKHISVDNPYRNLSNINSVNLSDIREDEFDIYGKYIASQLRKMNVVKALRVQLEIQSIVSEARLSEMTE